MMVRRWSIILMLPALLTDRASASDIDDFLKSYRESRTRLLAEYDQCRISGVMTQKVTVTDPGAVAVPRHLVQELEYVRVGQNEKLAIRTREAEIGGTDKRALYPSGVMIRRGAQLYAVKGPTETGDYSLFFRGGSDLFPPGHGELNENRGRFFRPACEAPGYNLPNFLDKPELSIQSVKSMSRDGESLVRVDYTVRLNDPKLPHQRGWCLLKPEWDWALRVFDTTYEGATSFSYSGEVEYKPDPDPAPRPRVVRLKYTTPTFIQTTEFPYDRFDFEACPPEEFSLVPYGLAEAELGPAQAEAPPARPGNRLPIWFAGIAAVALMLTIGLRVLMKRRDRARSGAGGEPV